MRKIILIAAAAAALASCVKEVYNPDASEVEKNYTIGIMPAGDIMASYSPLTKSGEVLTTWYGINIKRDGEDYMLGLYDDISKFKVQLSTEHSYSFEITAVRSDQDFIKNETIICDYGGTSGRSGVSISYPFNLRECIYILGNGSSELFYCFFPEGIASRNEIVNSLFDKFYSIDSGHSFHSGNDYRIGYTHTYSFPNINNGRNSNEWYRFYGTKNNFTPSKDETLPFNLKHEGFGLRYSVSGICDGSVSVVIDNAQSENTVTYFSQPAITTNFTSPQKVIEFRDMTAETEQVKVTVVWTRGNNVVDNLGSTTVNVRRNKLNKISITLGEHSSSKSMSVSTDASDYFGNENDTITI